jgi:two-component system response regulator PilR (NtrC family)/two-component system response regulator HydG
MPARLLAATRFNLLELTERGEFFRGLYHYFSRDLIHVPSLPERIDDLPLLSRYFLRKFSREYGKSLRGFSSSAERALLRYGWPGNVRELENVIGRACLLADGDRVEIQDLSIACVDAAAWPGAPLRHAQPPSRSSRARRARGTS